MSKHMRFIGRTSALDLRFVKWPPIFGFLHEASDEAIQQLESDIDLVVRCTRTERQNHVARFLHARRGCSSEFYGGLFDVCVKAAFGKHGLPFCLDARLPNGRDSDVVATINNRDFHIEATVITESDEDRGVWDRYLEAKKRNPNLLFLRRPGPFCPPNAKRPSVYHDMRRLYLNAFEKTTGGAERDLDPTRSQFADDEPNVLLVSFCGSGVSANKPANWALEELFADSPSASPSSPGIPDTSLSGWLDHRIREVYGCDAAKFEACHDKFETILDTRRRLGAVMLFDNCSLKVARLNYNAHESCRLSHREMAQLEQILGKKPPYSV